MEKISKTSKATKLCKCSVERIVERGYVRASKKRKPKFGKVDEFWKNLIRETTHNLYSKNPLQLLMLFKRN